MKKALLLDTNLSSLPIYDYLVKSGLSTYVIGINPNDFLAKFSLNYINSDYSDFNNICHILEKYKFDFIVPGCNDVSYEICSRLSKIYKIPGIINSDINLILNNKLKFRNFAIKNNIPVPLTYQKNSKYFEFPIIVKPADSFSGKGVTVLNNENNDTFEFAISSAKSNSKNSEYVIEQYVAGQLYSHSAFISNNNIEKDFIVKEDCIANKYAVDTSCMIYDFPEEILLKIRNSVQKISKLLNLCDGLFHTQFISNGSDIWIIEPTRRCPGDLYSSLICYSTDFNYVENYVRPFLNLPFSFNNNLSQRNIIRHTITNSTSCNLRSLKFNLPTNILEYFPLINVGDEIKPAPQGRVGILFFELPNMEDAKQFYKSTTDRVLYNLY